MTHIDASIRAVVDHHFCNEPLDVRFKWRRALAEAVEHRTNIVGSDSKPINSPRMWHLLNEFDRHLNSTIRKESKRTPNSYTFG